jgi:hypothetical protein
MFSVPTKNKEARDVKAIDVAILAHFDPHGELREDLVSLLHACVEQDIRVIVVSTNLSETNLKKIPQQVKVIRRANYGYDFYSYKYGIAALLNVAMERLSDDLSWHWENNIFQGRIRKLTLLNSSFYIGSPRKITAAISAPQTTDLQGLTFSEEISPHIQSFFVGFNERTLNAKAFRSWWQNMTPISERQAVIEQYELGMTKWFQGHGHTIGAMYHPSLLDTLRSAFSNRRKREFLNKSIIKNKRKLNPTMYFWFGLWQRFSIAKIELIERNPLQFNLKPLFKDPIFRYQRNDA